MPRAEFGIGIYTYALGDFTVGHYKAAVLQIFLVICKPRLIFLSHNPIIPAPRYSGNSLAGHHQGHDPAIPMVLCRHGLHI